MGVDAATIGISRHMGYDLTNSSGQTHQWKVLGWWHLLNLAREYGWLPRGTEAPSHSGPGWDGNYFQNDGQLVTADDATALAEALDRLLADPNRDAAAASVGSRKTQIALDNAGNSSSNARDVLRYPIDFIRGMLGHFGRDSIGVWQFGPKADQYLRQFIEFCRAGPFTIE
jgi:hypothetical protein